MKNKNLIILVFLTAFFLIWPILTNARVLDMVNITYKPNVPIPIQIGNYNFAKENIVKGGDFLASYIVAIYTYGAGFAGIVAMFMLVIAGWRWLFAAGNASKIAASKDMVNGVLVGLALLFGGQLLLRQISEDFSSVKSLEIKLPVDALTAISENAASEQFCATSGEGGTPEKPEKVTECSEYQNPEQCLADSCNLIAVGDFDARCMPFFDRASGNFTGCSDCPNTCECTDYTSAYYQNIDPCDCDEDQKWTDNECKK